MGDGAAPAFDDADAGLGSVSGCGWWFGAGRVGGDRGGQGCDECDGRADFVGADEESGQHIAAVAGGGGEVFDRAVEWVLVPGVGVQAAGTGDVAEGAEVAGGLVAEYGGAGESVGYDGAR